MKPLTAQEGQASSTVTQCVALLLGLVHGSKRANHRKGAGELTEVLQIPQVFRPCSDHNLPSVSAALVALNKDGSASCDLYWPADVVYYVQRTGSWLQQLEAVSKSLPSESAPAQV